MNALLFVESLTILFSETKAPIPPAYAVDEFDNVILARPALFVAYSTVAS